MEELAGLLLSHILSYFDVSEMKRASNISSVRQFSVLIIVLLFSFVGRAYGQEWLSLYNQSLEYYNTGEYKAALSTGEDALSKYKQEADTGHANFMAILRQLSVTAYALNDIPKAVSYAKEEVDGWRSVASVDEATYISALDNLGVINTSAGSFENAIANLSKALEMVSLSSSLDEVNKAIIEGHLAEALYGGGELTASEEHFVNVMNVLDSVEEVPADYLNFCYSYGTLSAEQGNNETAIKYLSKLFQWYEETEQDPLVVNSHIGLGSAYSSLNRLQEGESHLRMAISALEANPQLSESSLSEIKKKLADNLGQQGRAVEAKKILDSIRDEMLTGDDASEERARFLNSQATTLLATGKVLEALTIYDEALNNMIELEKEGTVAFGLISLNATKANEQAGDLLKAQRIAEQALSTQPKDQIVYFQLLAELGNVFDKQGNIENAEQYFKAALATDRLSWPAITKARILNIAGSFYQQKGNFELSDNLYNEALACDGVESEEGLYQSLLFNYVTLLQAGGKIDDAEILLADLKSSISDENTEVYLGLLRNMGALAQSKGDYDLARERYREAFALVETKYGTSNPQYADILLRQATLDKDLGKYDEAEPKFIEVGKIVAEVQGRNHPNYASVANNMGILYQQMGNYDKAEAKFKEAINIYGSVYGESHPDYVVSLENLATLYEIIGEQEKALDILSGTLEANKNIYGEQNPNYAVSLHNYASLLQKTDRKDEAFQMFEKVLELQRKTIGEYQPSYANSLHNLAILAQEKEDFALADSLINRTLDIRENLFNKSHPSYTSALYSKAVLLQVSNRYEEGWKVYNEVIDSYLEQIDKYFPSLSETEKNAFYAKLAPVVNRYKEFCLEYYVNFKKDDEVLKRLYDVQLATKALLLNAVNKTRAQILNSKDEKLIADFSAWNNLKKQLVKYYNYSREQLTREGIDIHQLEDKANTMEKELSSSSALFADQFDQRKNTWKDVQMSLSDRQAAFEIIRLERNGAEDSITYIALSVMPGDVSPQLAILPFGEKLDGKYFNYYKNTIRYGVHDQRSYNIFWQPMQKLIDGAQTVFISADGVYNKININTIYNTETKHYLIEDMFFRYVSSTKDLNRKPPTHAGTHSISCFGDPAYDLNGDPLQPAKLDGIQRSQLNMTKISPLPGTRNEITFIDSLLTANQWDVNSYLGATAQERVLKRGQSPEVIHLATHGFFTADLSVEAIERQTGRSQFEKNPLFRSGLLFAGASNKVEDVENDGVLTAYEAMNLYLDDTDLMVLSACETALGDVKNGEGVYGLQRALIVAGVDRLIMSLWKVNDAATMQLMTKFYTKWVLGEDVYQALQKAQVEMMKEYEEPYYWGAFIMIGR